MRKFQNVTIWGPMATATVPLSATRHGTVVCKHPFTAARPAHHIIPRAYLAGACAFGLFPTLKDVVSRFDSDGLRADWEQIGADLRHAFAVVSETEPSDVTDDREVA